MKVIDVVDEEAQSSRVAVMRLIGGTNPEVPRSARTLLVAAWHPAAMPRSAVTYVDSGFQGVASWK